jgi:hypothetical protein
MFSAEDDAQRVGPDPDFIAIADELQALKASRASHYRAGVRIEGEDIPRKVLGEDYTREELRALAISRAFEKRGYSTSEVARLLPVWLERFDSIDHAMADGLVR